MSANGTQKTSDLADRAVTSRELGLDVRNATGGTLTAGTLVCISGYNYAHSRPLIVKADANAARKKAAWILHNAVVNNTNCRVGKTYRLTGTATANVDTSATAVGDPIYLSATAGGWTKTDPFDSVTDSQQVGTVRVVSATVGAIDFDLTIDNVKLSTLNVAISGGSLAFSGVISPGAFAASADDYNPTGLATASTLRLTSTGAQNMTGIVGGAAGRILILHNIGAANITLKDEVTSTAANRFALPADLVLVPDAVAILQYDATTSRWRSLGSGEMAASGDLAGSYPSPTVAQSSTAFALTGDISPAALAAGTDNWAPASLSTASVIRVDLTGSQDLTGITGGADGRLLVLHNIDGGADALTLKNDVTSTAANRFLLTGDVVVAPQESVLLQYDSTVSRWRLIKTSGAPSGAAGGKLSGTYPNPGMGVGFITADATGRAYFGAGVLDKATALSAFAADSLDNTFLLDAVENGAFVADDATRALFAANFIGNSVTGRGLMQTGWFDVATVLDKFAVDSVANAALIQVIADGSFQADAATRALFADWIWTSAKMSENLIKYVEVNASSAQLKDLFANPLQMVAAQGAGKVLEFISATMILDAGGTPYDTQGTLTFIEETSLTALSASIADTWLFGVTDKIKSVQAIDAFTTANKAILLSCATANPASGDGVARIKVAYRVHTTGL